MSFEPCFLATAVGSMPHSDPVRAVDVVLSTIPEAPIWPQLSGRGLNEQMEIQYSEGMPCRVIDREKGRMFFETSGDYIDAFTEFYETYMLAMDPDRVITEALASQNACCAGAAATALAASRRFGSRSSASSSPAPAFSSCARPAARA